jgi:hypothetical protein
MFSFSLSPKNGLLFIFIFFAGLSAARVSAIETVVKR